MISAVIYCASGYFGRKLANYTHAVRVSRVLPSPTSSVITPKRNEDARKHKTVSALVN